IVSDPDVLEAAHNAPPTTNDQARLAALALSVMPAVSDDTIYVNAGDLIAAFDRYTLSPRWPERRFESTGVGAQTRALARRAATRGVTLDDTSSVVVAGPWLVAVTGSSAGGGRRMGDPRIHALDAQTGDIAWSVNVASLDPALEGAVVRGRPVVHGGVLVVAASRQLAQRRLESVQLVGIDLASGTLLWRTPLASAGALPYNAATSSSDNPIESRAMALRSDEPGAVGPAAMPSRRPAWTRRSGHASLARRGSWPYVSHPPAVIGGRAYIVSPDATRLAEVDATTGGLLRTFDTENVG